jgi:phage terminase large subunit
VELSNHGLNAQGAKKGKDSILHGIQWLQQQKIIIDKVCIETIAEFEQYHWEKNKNGEVLNKPADRDNHHIDGIRYAMESEMLMDADGSVQAVGETASSMVDW